MGYRGPSFMENMNTWWLIFLLCILSGSSNSFFKSNRSYPRTQHNTYLSLCRISQTVSPSPSCQSIFYVLPCLPQWLLWHFQFQKMPVNICIEPENKQNNTPRGVLNSSLSNGVLPRLSNLDPVYDKNFARFPYPVYDMCVYYILRILFLEVICCQQVGHEVGRQPGRQKILGK